jgi:hypothetical protein
VLGNTVSVDLRDPAIANQPWDCGFALVLDPAGDAGDATAQVPLAAGAPPAPPGTTPAPPVAKPSCRVAAARVRRGRSLKLRCNRVRGVVSVRLAGKGKRARKLSARVNGRGSARLKIRGLRRGRYSVTVSQKGERLGGRRVRVR